MGVVIRRVLERARLRPSDRAPERGVRRGVTFVPRRGVRVVQETAPLPPPAPPTQPVADTAGAAG
jgi:hypothetical protein